jgi:hypothetical protein
MSVCAVGRDLNDLHPIAWGHGTIPGGPLVYVAMGHFLNGLV